MGIAIDVPRRGVIVRPLPRKLHFWKKWIEEAA